MTKIFTFTINPEAKEQFHSFVERFGFDPYKESNKVAKVAEGKLRDVFPNDLINTLQKMGREGEPGIILVKNMPIDPVIPKGETVQERVKKKGHTSQDAIIGTASLMGYVINTSEKEQGGKLIHDVAPVRGREKEVSSSGRKKFFLHIENPFETAPPDFLMLVGLEGDPKAKTTCFLVNDILVKLPDWVVDGMKKPEFEIRSGQSFSEQEKNIFPLIRKESNGRMRLRLYEEMERINPLSSDAKKILDEIADVFKEIQGEIQGIALEPGESIIFNNGWGLDKPAGVMHGRGGYIENPNRWLQRGFMFQQSAEDQNSLAEGYYSAIKMAVNNENGKFSLREGAEVLRHAMRQTKGYKKYMQEHPDATDAQALLYGDIGKGASDPKSSWVERVAKEAVQGSIER